MGNIHGHDKKNYYTKSNSFSKKNDIKNMSLLFSKNFKNYLKDPDVSPNEDIKIILHLSDFYAFLNSKYHSGYISVYERKLYGLTNQDQPEINIKSDRPISADLYRVINNAVIEQICDCENQKVYLNDMYNKIYDLQEKIENDKKLCNDLHGDELKRCCQSVVSMTTIIKELKNDLYNKKLLSSSTGNFSKETLETNIENIEFIIKKCDLFLNRIRHTTNIVTAVPVMTEPKCIPSAPPMFSKFIG